MVIPEVNPTRATKVSKRRSFKNPTLPPFRLGTGHSRTQPREENETKQVPRQGDSYGNCFRT